MSEQGRQHAQHGEELEEALRQRFGDLGELTVPQSNRRVQRSGGSGAAWLPLQVVPGRGRQMLHRGFRA